MAIANMLHCPTFFIDIDFRLRLTLITLSAIAQDVASLETTCIESNDYNYYQNFIAHTHTHQDQCSSKYYIPHINVLSHKTLTLSVPHLPIAIFLLSITLGVCLIALNLNH